MEDGFKQQLINIEITILQVNIRYYELGTITLFKAPRRHQQTA